MNKDMLHLIKSGKIFASLDEEAYSLFLSKLQKISLKKNETLFSQGDLSNYLYLLADGKLSISISLDQDQEKVICHIDPGQTFGELGALTNEPRAFTVKADEDSAVLRLPKKIFVELCNKYPAMMLAVIENTQETLQFFSLEKSRKHIAIIPVNSSVVLDDFSKSLVKYTKKLSSITLLSDLELDKDNQKKTQVELKNIINEVTKNKKPKRKILYLLKSTKTPLAKLCLKKVDTIYLIANYDTTIKISRDLESKIEACRSRLISSPALILLQPKNAVTPKNTKKWLALMDFSLHHHVRKKNQSDFLRLLRFIRGKPIGLVLGGGGTRGWAHLGAIRALREAKIPIDIIGGTSVGGIVSGCYAINQSIDEAYNKFYKIVEGSGHTVSLRNLTWPAISLFNAKDFTLSQKNAFGDLQIEDLWIPYFCTSCNLSQYSEEVHREGTLWEKIRCSTAIPGLIPPMVLEGEMHFDGGLLNNLPVDVMRKIIGKRGKIIAVELVQDTHSSEKKYHFPPMLTFTDALFSKLHIGHKKYQFPQFIDTFLKALLIGSSLRAQQNAALANILISPNLSEYNILHSDAKKAKKLIDLGYHSAHEQIAKLKNKT